MYETHVSANRYWLYNLQQIHVDFKSAHANE